MGESALFRKLSVLMPVYNERWTLRTIVERVLTSPVPLEIELVIVDDCSSDGSWEVIEELAQSDPRVKAIRHHANGGKGTAIRSAIARMSGDIAVVQDADLEYDPHEFGALVQPILEGKADAVFGSRYAGTTRRAAPFWHTQVNRFLTLVSNVLTGVTLTDMETCYKVVRADILKQLRLRSTTFTLEPELTSRLAQWGARIYEVPISYSGRSFLEGKKIRPIDGAKAIAELLRCRFVDRRFTDHPTLGSLKQCDQAQRCHKRIAAEIAPFVGKRVLHVDCGVGSLGGFFLGRERVILAESEPIPAALLGQRFARRENLSIERGSMESGFDIERWRREQVDTIVWADWLGRGASQRLVEGCHGLLPEGGHCILLMPGASSGDAAALPERLLNAGFEIAAIRPVGRLPRLGAALTGGRLRQNPAARLRWLNRLMPLAKYTDRWFLGPELFQIVVARKRSAGRQRLAA